MRLLKSVALCLLVLTASRCATAPPPPETPPAEINPHIGDPRVEQTALPPRGVQKRFTAAWDAYRAGRLADADREFAAALREDPDYFPAQLGQAAVAISRGDLERAEGIIEAVEQRNPDSRLTRVYRGEIALMRGDLQRAHDLYKAAAEAAATPEIRQRYEEIRSQRFDQLFAEASAAQSPETAIRLFREALVVNEDSSAARRLLAQRLVELRRFDDARQELERLIRAGTPDDDEIQTMLAEIEVGTGRYQEAIARYERVVRRSGNPAFRRRLDTIKQEWTEANMPAHQRRALDATAINREDLAVLIYWTIPAVRFARNLSEPPIAIDISDVIAREELVRSMAFRFFTVDPVTRRVDPYRMVSAGNVLRILSRIMMLRGTPPCANAASQEPNELLRSTRILASCGVNVADLAANPDSAVSGRIAARALNEIAAAMKSAEERQTR